MSAPGENKWHRNSRGGSQQPPSRDRSGASTPSQPAQTANKPANATGNAWTERARNNAKAKEAAKQSAPPVATPTAPSEEQHVPINGFNSMEVKEFLKKNFYVAIAGDSQKQAQWKAGPEHASAKSGGAWGQKPSIMANKQDFWVQLAKQVASREQGGGG